MNRCEAFQENLTLYCSGDLLASDARELEQHLASCESCEAERRALMATIESLDRSVFYPHEDQVGWDRFAAETAGLATGKVVPFRKRFLRPVILARAAAVVLAVGLGWVALQPQVGVAPMVMPPVGGLASPQAEVPVGTSASPETTPMVMSADFQRRLELNLAREETRQYLTQSRDLLLSVLESPVRCSKNQLDITAERKKSMELLRRKQFLRDDLDRPELARAAELCDRLEGILTEISTLKDCADMETIQQLRDAVKRNQLLVKIRVAEKELGGKRV